MMLTTLSFLDSFANTYFGGILILVAFINAPIDFYQIQKSRAIFASSLAIIPPICRVVRGGTIVLIAAADLVYAHKTGHLAVDQAAFTTYGRQ